MRDRRGNVLALVAISLPLLLGAAAAAIDTIHMTARKRELQRQADSAALAGAHARYRNQAADPAARRALTLGGQVTLSSPAQVNSGPASGAYAGNNKAVEVILRGGTYTPFIRFFTGSDTQLEARAVAAIAGTNPACILALDPTAKYGVEMTGNATMALGCGIAANSSHGQSIRLTGNLSLTGVSDVTAVGGIEVSGNAQVPNALRQPNSPVTADPLAGITAPALPSACTRTNFKADSGTHTLTPGRYCGFLEIGGSANVTFNPGTYIIAGEFFKINGGPASRVTGNGVTFILTSRSGKWAYLDWNGDTTINLAAPTVASGSAYAGLLLMQDRQAPSSTKNYVNGNLRLTLRGSLYFPNQWFEWNGNVTGTTRCLRIIARQMYLNGNLSVQNDCTADDGVLAGGGRRVRLVE